MDKIPVVDFKQVQSRDINDRRRAGQQIVEGLHAYGVYHLENHGIEGLRDKFFEGLHAYACLSEETRRGHIVPDSWGQRGWAEGEKSVTEEGLDFKGWWFANPAPPGTCEAETAMEAQWPKLYPPNYWPDDFPSGFAKAYMAYGRAIHQVNITCQGAEGLALGLDHMMMVGGLKDGPHNFRGLIYHALTEEMLSRRTAWGGAHTDFNDETVLAGRMWITPDGELTDKSPDPESGLWIQVSPDQWIPGNAPQGCIAIQCGQEKEVITGGFLKATPHVIRPPNVVGYRRLAGAHFVHRHPNGIMMPMGHFATRKNLEAYAPPKLFGTFAEITLHQIGLTGLSNAEMVARLGYNYTELARRLGQTGPAAG